MAIKKEVVKKIIEMRKQNIGMGTIANELNISHKVVSYHCKKNNLGGVMVDTIDYGKDLCEVCGCEFDKKTTNQKYCSKECRKKTAREQSKNWYQHIKEKNKTIYKNICLYCEEEFETTTKSKKYCSDKCCLKFHSRKAWNKNKKSNIKICKYCEKEFIDETKFNRKKYCSDDCHKNWMNENPIYTKTCPICNIQFRTNLKVQINCSTECQWESQKRNKGICNNCGKEYNPPKHHSGKFCSRKCFIEYTGIKEVKEYKYKSNLTDASSIRRAKKYGVKYENLDPLEIFERDNWICGICGEKIDKQLNYPDKMSATLDHIIPLSKGGTHTKDNVQASHGICNYRKGNSE